MPDSPAQTFDAWWNAANEDDRNGKVAQLLGWTRIDTVPDCWDTQFRKMFPGHEPVPSGGPWWLQPGMTVDDSPIWGLQLPDFMGDIAWAWTVLDHIREKAGTPFFWHFDHAIGPIHRLPAEQAASQICRYALMVWWRRSGGWGSEGAE